MMDDAQITYIGKVDHRNKLTRFGIRAKDRTKHMYVIGKTGTGKSTFLENMLVQDIQNGNGLAFIDPHGELANKILDYIPEWRVNDVIYLNPADVDFPIAFNPLEDLGPEKRHLIADGLMSVFEKIWPEAFSGRMTYILNNTMLALLESPDSTMLGVNRMLTDKEFRKKIVANVTDPAVKNAWEELMKWDDKRWSDAIGALVNKVGQFTTNPIIRNMIGQTKSTFDFRKAMDERKIIIINLSKGMIGEQNAPLIGAMLITKIYLAAMSRAEMPPEVLKQAAPFYFYVDEFQNFANESFASILSEARKYKLCLTVANQYIAQMEDTIRDAVFGNMGTTLAFRVGPLDAEFMEKFFAPVFTQEDLQNIAFGQYYITLQIDNMGSKPFSAQGLGPIPPLEVSMRNQVIAASRAQFARTREEVETTVMEWFSPTRKAVVRSDIGNPSDAPRPNQYNNAAPARPANNFPPRPVTNQPNRERSEFSAPQKTFPPRTATNQPAQASRPMRPAQPTKETPIASYVKPNAPVQKTSPTLQNLLGKLDTLNVEETPEKNTVKEAVVEPVIVQQEPVTKTVSDQAIFVPKATAKPLDTKLDRAASIEKKSALQEALARAMAANKKPEPVATAPQPAPIPEGIPGVAPTQHSSSPEVTQTAVEAPKVVEQPVVVQSTVHEVTPEAIPTPQPEPPVTIPEMPKPAPEPTPKPKASTFSYNQTVREVPEDILRRVLE